MCNDIDGSGGSREAFESKVLAAVALGRPEAEELSKQLATYKSPREELEKRALRAVALGQAEADTLIKQLG